MASHGSHNSIGSGAGPQSHAAASAAAARSAGGAPAAAAGEPGTSGRGGSGTSGPYVLGLTGSIGMGKSTVSAMLRARGVPVVDADAIVHALYAPGGAAVAPVGAAFPSAVAAGAVDRAALSAAVVGRPEAMAALEGIVHPLVEAERVAAMREAAERGAALVVLDIPLLFETGGEGACDGVAVVSAPAGVQRARVLARPGMTPEKFEAILGRQVPDAEKRARADFVIDTGCSLRETEAAVDALLAGALARGSGGAYARAVEAAAGAGGGHGSGKAPA
ncbi:hypothetical protein Rsub_10285 [Raphidocelis subcapitata]|uniref:Dephospho-kinase n=1 Tax=Raphidocelis subcapitata TaxID=307507 RepID=A0A2V0PL51_9CHLO|nr:hypothetical protein Rsub_10285 [Raphidocelis subcapitata]|eukprot:GBF98057.1 hypothetical protein Rsub_10285 [Raphidocelis subcapitata]